MPGPRPRIAKSLRLGFAAFIGLPQTGTIIADLSARATSLLNGFVTQGWLTAWKDLRIVQDSVDPTQIDITVRVAPPTPIDFIYITGDVSVSI